METIQQTVQQIREVVAHTEMNETDREKVLRWLGFLDCNLNRLRGEIEVRSQALSHDKHL